MSTIDMLWKNNFPHINNIVNCNRCTFKVQQVNYMKFTLKQYLVIFEILDNAVVWDEGLVLFTISTHIKDDDIC